MLQEIFQAVALGLLGGVPVVVWHVYQIIKSNRANKVADELFWERERALDEANDDWIKRYNLKEAQRRAMRLG